MIQKYHYKEFFLIYLNKLAKRKHNVRRIFYIGNHLGFLFLVRNHVQIASNAYEAARESHALVICTEWDEFKVKKEKLINLNDK
jgi:UDP-glucose 6-dehydrogenase